MNNNRMSIIGVILLAVPAVATAYFANAPRYLFRDSTQSALVLTFKHTSHRVHECSEDEKTAYVAGIHNLTHSRNAAVQCGSRERNPVGIRIVMDGKEMAGKEITPLGWRHDSAVFVFEKFIIPPGEHRMELALRDSGKTGADYDYRYEGMVRLEPGKIVVVDFNAGVFQVRG